MVSDRLDEDQETALTCILDSVIVPSRPKTYFYITGFAGTGKTHLAKALVDKLQSVHKKPVVLAWNGMAARVLGGDTIMSFFNLTYDRTGHVGDNGYMRSPQELARRILANLTSRKRALLQSLEAVLLIDEVSVINSSILDGISYALKDLRRGMPDAEKPFGGLTAIMVGDPCQLGRVDLFAGSEQYQPDKYPTGPFWRSEVWRGMHPVIFYLQKFHRGEGDDGYLQLLSEIRTADQIAPGIPNFSAASLEVFGAIRDRDGGSNPPKFNHTIICLTNAEAEAYNDDHLQSLPGDLHTFQAIDNLDEHHGQAQGLDIDSIGTMGYREKVRVLPDHCQQSFYTDLHKHLNITRDLPDEDHLVLMVEEIGRAQRDRQVEQTLTKRAQETYAKPSRPIPDLGSTSSRPSSPNHNPHSSQAEPLSGISEPSTPHMQSHSSEESDSDEADASTGSEGDVEETDPEEPHPSHGREGFDPIPFIVFRGPIGRVVERYLEENPHYRLVGCTIDSLYSGRKTCSLICKRSIPKSLRGKAPSGKGKPDWRSWPESACPMAEVLVTSSGSLCSLYGLTIEGITKEQWRSHEHPHGTYKCHSGYLPAEIADDWCEWMSTSHSPTTTMAHLIEKTNKKHIEGGYSAKTMAFISEQKLREREKLRGAYRSIQEHGKSGLSIDAFLEQLRPVMHDIDEVFKSTMTPVIQSLGRIKKGIAVTEDLERATVADRCIAFKDVLCTRASTGKLADFGLVLTSCRMLSNLSDCVTIGLDASFNLLFADLAVCASSTENPQLLSLTACKSLHGPRRSCALKIGDLEKLC
ncbi:hypothetical protein FOZ63_030075 [Perkinsus olseni]|uniref:ATP-dependent DNA helicase n=1 Tax=Perkinsus olseni TaxID=32597 RepID=A0A7J6Q335_PEROL|nr:hypothetical protein FOZ63_030075 [Perkinsus olseni]